MSTTLPKITDIDTSGKKVLVRADLDVDIEEGDRESVFRLKALVPTLEHLIKGNASKIILLGHRGRPDGKKVEELSLQPVAVSLEKILNEKLGREVMEKVEMYVMENLRFDKGEDKNDPEYAEKLAEHGEIYVNDAFAASHRSSASIVGLPKLMTHAAGIRFVQEVENLEKLLENPQKPVISLISGVKEDKLEYAEAFTRFSDKVLVAGRLPEYIEDRKDVPSKEKLVVAKLLPDKEDITIRSMEEFESWIAKAGTIIVGGPVGRFENEGHRQGTRRVFEAVANSSAYKVAGGGDTHKALDLLGLTDKFDWVSVGGGAMLEFLANGTLPGIKALID